MGIQEVLLYYTNSFARLSIQIPHHFKLVEKTVALPISDKVKAGEETNKNNKTIYLKGPRKPKHKPLKPEQTFRILSGETCTMCSFFFPPVLVFFAFLCIDVLKKCHQPLCTNYV